MIFIDKLLYMVSTNRENLGNFLSTLENLRNFFFTWNLREKWIIWNKIQKKSFVEKSF